MTVLLDRPRVLLRKDSGMYAYERGLARAGFAPVAGADEAGRGACAGPLVVGAAVLSDGKRGQVPGLADSKLLTPAARERAYDEVVKRALAWSVVIVEPAEVDRMGLHRCNIEAMRRALARLDVAPSYVLTDGFPVAGLGVPGLAMWKGDQVAACIAAASVIAKVTRDRIMVELNERWPGYGFDEHKGYVTGEHQRALERLGASPVHRRSYVNVARVLPEGERPRAVFGEESGIDDGSGDADGILAVPFPSDPQDEGA
ncbi:ribonuclease HII [Phytoactinopolyspora halotolerans]|uniref:Ribonuclease HII n=1 Tax=Phytoactinopolyspora halotolerans TaxID=1981512 RepID=A0A6L9SEZ4_9ACTN|nr:ribonuclease HII [Phytoactinopolyspora halotolerans]NEE03659.1 ribonuclease HII [Phytoactinopolyspora halotolerans]